MLITSAYLVTMFMYDVPTTPDEDLSFLYRKMEEMSIQECLAGAEQLNDTARFGPGYYIAMCMPEKPRDPVVRERI